MNFFLGLSLSLRLHDQFPGLSLVAVIALGNLFTPFSDHLGSQVHHETNFGKFVGQILENNPNGKLKLFQQI